MSRTMPMPTTPTVVRVHKGMFLFNGPEWSPAPFP